MEGGAETETESYENVEFSNVSGEEEEGESPSHSPSPPATLPSPPPPAAASPPPPPALDNLVVPEFSVVLQLNAPGDVADYDTATIAVGLASAAGVDASRVEVWLAAGSVLIQAKISADSSAQAEALATSLAPAFASPVEAGATLGFQVESVHTPPTAMLDGARITGQTIPPPSPVASPPAPSPAGEGSG